MTPPTYALENIIQSSSSQENQHFINNIPSFKAKDPESLTNKEPYKLALTKLQGSFTRKISSFLPSMGYNKIKEWLHYNFGSVATKQHAASMLIDQQQTPAETLQEYVKQISDFLLKSSGLLTHQAKYLTHITYFIHNLYNQILHHNVLGKNPASVQNTITIGQKKMLNYTLLKAYIIMIQNNKLTISSNKLYQNLNSNTGSYHGWSSPHL